MTNPAARYGPIAAQEYDNAPDYAKVPLGVWLTELPTLPDDEFGRRAASAIHDSALANRFRGNWDHDHCKATAAFKEAQARHWAAGHTEACTGDTIYSRAFRQIWIEQGHDRSSYQPKPCTCGGG